MVPAYYRLITSYAGQDSVVATCAAFALLVGLGWLAVRRFGFGWLNRLYVAQMLIIWVGILFYFSFIG